MSSINFPQPVEFPRGEQNRQELDSLIKFDHIIKSDNTLFRVGRGLLQFPHTNMATGQLRARTRALQEWAENPINPQNGSDGHAFSVMVAAVLGQTLQEQGEGLIALPSPATVQFIDNNLSKEWGPSGDIIVAEEGGGDITPRLLISTHMSNRDSQRNMRTRSEKLNVPLFHLYGDNLFENGGITVFNFGSAKSPRSYIDSLARSTGPYLNQVIGVEMSR